MHTMQIAYGFCAVWVYNKSTEKEEKPDFSSKKLSHVNAELKNNAYNKLVSAKTERCVRPFENRRFLQRSLKRTESAVGQPTGRNIPTGDH